MKVSRIAIDTVAPLEQEMDVSLAVRRRVTDNYYMQNPGCFSFLGAICLLLGVGIGTIKWVWTL